MFYKALPNGKYRYYEKYFNQQEGKWKQVSVTLTSKSRQAQAQAKRLLEEKIEKAETTLFGFSENLTVNDVKDEWLAIRREEIKESTYISQLAFLEKFFNHFGKISLRKVTNMMLQRYILGQKEWSRGYMVLNRTTIAVFFDYCIKVGYLSENPAKSVVLPRVQKNLEDIKRKRDRFLSKEEMLDYLSYLHSSEHHTTFNSLVEFLYLTGMRSGEALALRWDDFDRANRLVEVKHTLQSKGRRGLHLTSPKTLSGYRTISVNSRIVDLLDCLKEESQSEFIFTSRNHRPIYLSSFNDYLKRTFEASGVAKDKTLVLTSHVLRHSHISLLAEMNVPIRMIMERVGHSDEKTTLNIYTHVTSGMKEKLSMDLESLVLHRNQ